MMAKCSDYDIFGETVKVNDTFAAACKLDELTDDGLFSDKEKTVIAAKIVLQDFEKFAESFGDETGAALSEVLARAFGATGENTGSPKVDLQQDRARIKATMRMAYNMSSEELAETAYRDIVDLIAMSPHETPMGQALYYRTAKTPKQTKYNKDEVAHFKAAKKFYKLKTKHTNIDNMQAAQNELLAAYEKAAQK